MSSLQGFELAALALDAYQRGYFAGMPDLTTIPNDGLGSAPQTAVAGGIIVATSSVLGDDVDFDADFYAVAYLIGNEIVISYRGSDHLNWEAPFGLPDFIPAGADGQDVNALWNGQTPDQLLLALDFFNYVKGHYPSLPITTTGHSLGGALAGAVATLKNVDAVMFDNTAFEAATANIIRQVTSTEADFDPILAAKVFDGAEQPWSEFGVGDISAIALEGDVAGYFRIGREVDNVDMGAPLDPVSAHIQALLVLALYAREIKGETGDWLHAANAVFTQLSSDAIAAELNIDGANGNPASGVMKDMIASTVLPGSDNRYGNLAADSLVNDMQDLGRAIAAGLDVTSPWAAVIVRFAALQADYGVTGTESNGVLHYDATYQALMADYRDEAWVFNGTQILLSGDTLDFSSFLSDREIDQAERAALDAGPGRIDQAIQGVGSQGLHAVLAYESANHTVQVAGTAVSDGVTGTNGNEQFLLGGEADTVTPNGGVNWIDGGEGVDTLIDEHAWSDFDITFNAALGRYYFALRDSGTDPRIHVLDNMERFQLDGEIFTAGDILNQAPTTISLSAYGGTSPGTGLSAGEYLSGALVADMEAIDANRLDKFTWEIVGGSAHYTIDEDGVIRANGNQVLDYAFWRQTVGNVTREQWLTEEWSFEALLGTQYGVKVKVTDAGGLSKTSDMYFWLEESLRGTPLIDALQGGMGRTVIAGLAGADQINDPDWVVLDYSESDAGVRIARSSYTDLVMEGFGGHAEGDVITLGATSTRYDVIGSAFKDEIAFAYEVFAGAGDDVITKSIVVHAGDGYDTATLATDTRYVDFGAGGGELFLSANGGPYTGDMQTGTFQRMSGTTPLWTTTITGEYGKLVGSNSGDSLWGTSLADIVVGNGGFDYIFGRGGADIISGTGMLYGEDGDDTITVGGTSTAWGGADNDTLIGIGSYASLLGSEGGDTLIARASTVFMVGGEGADTFLSEAGANHYVSYEYATSGVGVTYGGYNGSGWAGEANGDILQGRFSFFGSFYADTFSVDLSSSPYAVLRAGAGNDVVNAKLDSSSIVYGDGMNDPSGSDDDTITTTGSVNGKVYGGRGNDIISGAGELHGDGGADTIMSGTGNHSIYLGVDNDVDTFVFSRMQGFDRVYDFTQIDVIRIGADYKYDSFDDVLANANQVGGNVDIWFEADTKITIMNYQKANLTADDFLFV